MDIVKKNMVSVICGVVAIVALVVAFVWPLDGWIETVKAEATERAGVQDKIDRLIKKSRKIPNVDPAKTVMDPLPQFPGTAVIAQARAALNAVQDDGDAGYKAAENLNKADRDLIVKGSLPKVQNQQIPIEFRKNFEDAMTRLRVDVLASGIPPTDEELKKRADALWKERAKKIVVVEGKPINLDAIQKAFAEEVRQMPLEMQKEMAEKKKMYVDPSAVLKVPDTMKDDGSAVNTWKMWWAQVNYWITSDVVGTIADINGASKNVAQSPVKNLLQLSIPETFFPGQGVTQETAAAAAALGGEPNPKLAVPENGAQTPTKRISNNLYDVVHFTMAVDIEADKIPLFLKMLPTNRFITVLRFEMFPVDPQLKQIEGYVYGDKPVMTLVLDCEALFLRSWTQYYMPKELREMLGVPEPLPPGKEKKDKKKD